MSTSDAFAGVVLAGGASRRMGRDKAFLDVDGAPLITVAVGALTAAGADPIEVVGGDAGRLEALGLTVRPDRWPGEGPLGGLVTALGAASRPLVAVLTCDLARIDGDDVAALVATLRSDPGAAVAAPISAGHAQLLTAAWRASAAPLLAEPFAAGERSVRGALAASGLRLVAVEAIVPSHLVDLDTPDDLHEHSRGPAAGPRAGGGQARRAAYPPAPMGIPEIDVTTAAARRAEGAVVLDVRNPDEYVAGHVPGAVLIPLHELPSRVAEVPEGELLVICRSGARSMKAAELLAAQGLAPSNIAGGTLAWIDAGFEVTTGDGPG